MAAQLDENIQYTDPSTSELLSNGYIYIGTSGLDAKLNPIAIYSDRGLNTQLANPQRTDVHGRAVNKIWIPGKYALKVESSANVQKLNDLDLGESSTSINNIALGNVQGTNDITAEGAPTVVSLIDKQTYIFIAAAGNTGAMTLKIDTTTAYPVKKDNEDFASGEIRANQVVVVIWNNTSSIFESINFNTTRIKTPAPELILEETGVTANNSIWGLIVEGEQLKIRLGNDAEDTFVDVLVLGRTANVGDLLNFITTNLQHNGVKIPTISSTDTQENKTFTSLVINTSITGTAVLDEDDMASDSNTQVATQQSIKAHVNNEVGYAFSANRNNVDQTGITTATDIQIEFDNEIFANGDYDDVTNYRFTPTVAGKYLLKVKALIEALGDGNGVVVKIQKNGTTFVSTSPTFYNQSGGVQDTAAQTMTIEDANGTTDYFEAFILHDHGSDLVLAGEPLSSNFMGSKVAQ